MEVKAIFKDFLQQSKSAEIQMQEEKETEEEKEEKCKRKRHKKINQKEDSLQKIANELERVKGISQGKSKEVCFLLRLF